MPAYRDDPSGVTGALEALPAGSAVSAVATRLLDLFTEGSIRPGSRLPPERQIAAALGVGRSAVREALAALELLGVIDVRPGSGSYLRGSASELLPQTLSWGVLLTPSRTVELLELRGGLEVQVARLAAARAEPEGLQRLEGALGEMRASVDDPERFVPADQAFHQALAEASGNALLVDLLQVVRSLLRVWVERAVEARPDAEAALVEHAAVLDAVRDRDPAAAALAMTTHMATASARLAEVSPED